MRRLPLQRLQLPPPISVGRARASPALDDAGRCHCRPVPGKRPGDDPALLIGRTFTFLRGLAIEAPLARDPSWTERTLDICTAFLDELVSLAG